MINESNIVIHIPWQWAAVSCRSTSLLWRCQDQCQEWVSDSQKLRNSLGLFSHSKQLLIYYTVNDHASFFNTIALTFVLIYYKYSLPAIYFLLLAGRKEWCCNPRWGITFSHIGLDPRGPQDLPSIQRCDCRVFYWILATLKCLRYTVNDHVYFFSMQVH